MTNLFNKIEELARTHKKISSSDIFRDVSLYPVKNK
jgi:hypothetical protein